MAQSSITGPTTVADEGTASLGVHQPHRKQSTGSRSHSSSNSKSRQSRSTAERGSTGNAHANSNTTDTRKGRGGSVMWTILLAGLLFSLADVFYMVWLVDRHSAAQGNRAPVPAAAIKQPREVLLREKQRILDLIDRAGIDSSNLDDQTLEDLPSWEEVVRLYGPKPIIYGLDRCQQFQETTKKLGFIGTAGAFVLVLEDLTQSFGLLHQKFGYLHSLTQSINHPKRVTNCKYL